jgi:hypothetical protein
MGHARLEALFQPPDAAVREIAPAIVPHIFEEAGGIAAGQIQRQQIGPVYKQDNGTIRERHLREFDTEAARQAAFLGVPRAPHVPAVPAQIDKGTAAQAFYERSREARYHGLDESRFILRLQKQHEFLQDRHIKTSHQSGVT